MSKIKNIAWWGAPQKFGEQNDDRKVSWLELFYDLVYVVVIAQLTHHLAAHLTWTEIGSFFFLFTFVYWSWVNGSLYHDFHAAPGIRTRYFTMLQMMVVASMAITINDAFKGDHQSFAVSITAMQVIITYLWWSIGQYDPPFKRMNKWYLVCYSISIVLLAASIFVSSTMAVFLWITALILNLAAGLVAAPSINKAVKDRGIAFSVSESMLERFGLFTIIVLGETILGIVNGIATISEKTSIVWITFMIGILTSFLLWWVYFELMSGRKAKVGYKYMQYLLFLHIPLLASLGLIGATISAILSGNDVAHHHSIRWIFGVAIAVFLVTGVLLSNSLQDMEKATTSIGRICTAMFSAAAVIILVAVVGGHLNAMAFVGINALVLLIAVIIATRVWVEEPVD